MSENAGLSTTISQYIASTDEEDGRPYSASLARGLSQRDLSLLQVIQGLGPTLTSDSDPVRQKALECLATTIEQVEPAVFTRQDVSVLVDFLVAKLGDATAVLYVLRALSTIVKLSAFVPSVNDNLQKVVSGVLASYEPRKHLARVRFHAFELLKVLLSTHMSYLRTNSQKTVQPFTEAFIHVASGEKDPRNLLVSFDVNSGINATFAFDDSHKQLVNDLFDVCFCYFPITFTPPPNDPYKITSQDLKGSLEATIASQSLFASDAFSGLLEKLTSTNPVVRNDILRTLNTCVSSYDPETVLEHWLSIWSALKFEILHNDVSIFLPTAIELIPQGYDLIDDTDDNKVLIQTLVVIRQLQRQIITQDNHQRSRNLAHESSYTEKFLASVTADLKDSVATVSKSFKQALVILAVLASESSLLFSSIAAFLFSPPIWGKYLGGEQLLEMEVDINELAVLNTSKQRELIDGFGYIFIAYSMVLDKTVPKEFYEENTLVDHKDQLLLFFGQLLQTSSNIEKTLKCKIVQQLIKMVMLPYFLSNQETTLIFGYMRDLLAALEKESPENWNDDIVVTEIIKGSVSIVEDTNPANGHKRAVLTETLLPFLMGLVVPERNFSAICRALGVIKKLSVNSQFLEVVSIRLLNKMGQFMLLELSPLAKADVFKEICATLLDAILNTQYIALFLTNSWYKNFVPRFFKCFFDLWAQIGGTDVACVEAAGSLTGNIIRFLDKSKHQTALDELSALFLLSSNNFGIAPVEILLSSSPMVGLFNQILANVDKTVSIEKALSPIEVSEFLSKIVTRCQNAGSSEYSRLGYLQMLAVLSNKMIQAELFEPYLEPALREVRSELSSVSQNKIEQLEVLVWVTKGLVMKIDSRGMALTQEIVDLLAGTNDALKTLASKSLGILVCDLPLFTIQSTLKKQVKLATTAAPSNVRLLYKQRLFNILLPKLMEGYKNTKDEVYLVSMSILVDNVLSSLLKGHLNDLASMVISSLPIDNSVIVGAALKTLKTLIDEAPELVLPHLNSIIERLATLAVVRIASSTSLVTTEAVRCEALVCLTKVFQNMDLEYTIPYQKSTIKRLEPALDDRKRLVRKYCCDLRQVLYELGR